MSEPLQPVDSLDTITAAFKAAPGTTILYDQETENGTASRHLHTLAHVRKGDGHLLLVPQPSLNDPNDPLSWSTFKKWATFGNALAYAFLGAVTGPIMAAWMIQSTVQFHVSLQTMSYANGATLVCQGVFTTIWMPFAIKFGRRPVYLLSTLLMGVACVWLAIASTKTYLPFILGRAFLGAWEAPIESIVPSTITDIFFLHDRGAKISLYGLSVLGGNELGPMLSAFIIQTLGMDWAFYIVAMFVGLNLVSMVLFMPETKFTGTRPQILLQEHGSDSSLEKPTTSHLEGVNIESGSLQARSWLQEVFHLPRPDPNINILHIFLRPFVLMAYPTVLWSCLIYGLALSWNVILGMTTAQLFAPPPYLFNSSAQGLVFLSPLVGSLVGTYLCGPLADQIANFYTRHNHGIREPEMRLPTCIIAAALTFFGAMMSALCFHYHTHWSGPVVGYGILSAGAQMGATLGMNYALDCHEELSVELMVTVASLKSLIAWIWTWVMNDWLAKDGPLTVFLVVAAVNVVVYLSTIVFYLRGKDIRVWLYNANLLAKAGLE